MNNVTKMADKKKEEFFKTAKGVENANWKLGDLLVEMYGPSSSSGIHDGSTNSLREFAQECEEQGLEEKYNESYLATLRVVSTKFQWSTRVDHASWSIHRSSDSPKMLTHIIRNHEKLFKDTPSKPKLTQRLAIQHKEKIEKIVEKLTEKEINKTVADVTLCMENLNEYSDLSDLDKSALRVILLNLVEVIRKFCTEEQNHIAVVSNTGDGRE